MTPRSRRRRGAASAALGLTAQGNVQLIKSELDGRCYFIEVNPKFAAAMGLTIGAGLNIPLLYVKLALGLRPEPERADPRARGCGCCARGRTGWCPRPPSRPYPAGRRPILFRPRAESMGLWAASADRA